jgi:hypothetical protein
MKNRDCSMKPKHAKGVTSEKGVSNIKPLAQLPLSAEERHFILRTSRMLKAREFQQMANYVRKASAWMQEQMYR